MDIANYLPMPSQKTLYILRHAKTEAGSAHQDDKSRRLVERGINAAQITGAFLYRQRIHPDKVICSDAVRTRQTWEQMESVYHDVQNVEFTPKLYLASANEMTGLLAGLPDAVKSVMLIGHNPGVHQLCLKFAKSGDEDLLDEMHLKFPTCALAMIDLGETAWDDLAHVRGTLVDYITPKMLAGISDD